MSTGGYNLCMKVRTRLFAGLHQLVGERVVTLEVPVGATAATLRDELGERYPQVRDLLPNVVCAVAEDYVSMEYELREGDDVALIPPVSGGSGNEDAVFAIGPEPIDPGPLVAAVRRDESGAVALFYGVVRNENLGRNVMYLEYDAYPEMAIKKMREVATEVRAKFDVTGVGVLHRTGRLEIGETSLLVAVSSGHRKEAFEACHFAVDRIKEIVPVWKKEVFEGGEAWIEGNVPSPLQSGDASRG